MFDDLPAIADNTTIRQLWPPGWLHPPSTAGETVSGRPVLNFSFALSHRAGGGGVRGHHVANLLIHALAALTLFGIVRRSAPGRTEGPAFVVALLWAVHPLSATAVTYLAQRAESLAGLFVLFSLYSFIRSATAGPAAGPAAHRWAVLSVGSALLGVGTKETAAAAPVLALLYDRTFLAGSFRAAWRQRPVLHAAVAATWIPLALLVAANPGRGGSAGFASSIDPLSYCFTQAAAIVHYLRLALLPLGQVFDYGTALVDGPAAVLPQLFLLAVLAGASLVALRRHHPAGFAGTAFFVLLAPTSSILPIATQTVAEHRMYLPLATLLALVVPAAVQVLHRRPRPRGTLAGLSLLAALLLGATTITRNHTYRSAVALWANTAQRQPDNPRAHHNHGSALRQAGREDEAIAAFQRAIALRPTHAFAHYELGSLLLQRADWEGAARHLGAAVDAEPGLVAALINLGQALTGLGRIDDAIARYRSALQLEPQAHDAATNLAALLIERRDFTGAEPLLRSAVAAEPGLAPAHHHLGRLLERTGRAPEAEASYRAATRADPNFARARLALGNLLLDHGDFAAAEQELSAAVRSDSGLASAHFSLGNLVAARRDFDAAIAAYQTALRLEPGFIEARANLANCQLLTGRLAAAIANYEAVLAVRPHDDAVRENLDLARERLRHRPRAAPAP